jgi:hypothetical protein
VTIGAWYHVSSSFVQGSSATVWIRDLTEEGIEPNPGHTCAYCSAELVNGVIRGGLLFCSDQHWMEHLQQQPDPTLPRSTRSSSKRGTPSSTRENSPVSKSARSSATEEEEEEEEDDDDDEDEEDDRDSDGDGPISRSRSKSARGDAFEKQVLDAVLQHPRIQHGKQIAQSCDTLGDLYFRLKEGDGKMRMVQCRIKSETITDTGLRKADMDHFRGVLFVLLNTKRRTFYVLMPEEWEETKRGGGKAERAKNKKHAIAYGEGSVPPRTEDQAWTKVTEEIVRLLPRSKVYTPSLSPTHQVEMTGMQIIQRVVAQHGNIYEMAEMANVQSSSSDLTFRGEKTQVKAASTTATRSRNYSFNLHHGRSGHRHPYDVGIAFIFVVNACKNRFYLVSAAKAKKLKIVGKGAPSQITLPHPNQCEADHPYYPFLFPPRA